MATSGLNYQVTADAKRAIAELKKLQSTVRLVSSAVRRDVQLMNTALGGIQTGNLGRVRTSIQSNITNPLNAAARSARQAAQAINSSFNGISGPIARSSSAIASFKGNLAAMAVSTTLGLLKDLSRAFITMSDDATNAQAKLQLAVGGWGSYGQAMRDVAEISRVTRSELNSTTTLYGKLSLTGKALNASQQQVARATQTVTTALKVSGASAQETTSTVLQLGQALSSGKLNGDEFRSMAENAPRLMQLLADSLEVPRGSLKKMASDGQLTADKLFKAFNDKKFTAALDEELKRMPKSFGDAFTAITNVAGQTFAAFNEGGEFSTALYNFADQGQTNMASIVDAAREAGGGIRDAFAGLSGLFDPLRDEGVSASQDVARSWRDTRNEIASIIRLFDNVRNLASGFSLTGGKGSGALIETSMLGTGKRPPARVDEAGKFTRNIQQSRTQRARQRVIRNTQRATGDYKWTGDGMSDQQVLDYSREQVRKGKVIKRTGGTGELRTPPGSNGSGGGSGDSSAKALAKHQRTLADLQKLEKTASGAALDRIHKRAEREKAIIANLRKGVGESAASAAAGGSGGSSAQSKEQREAERAAERYADAIQNLKDKKADLALTDDQRALADALEAAGLERNIALTGQKADEIRKLVASLQEGENAKKLSDALADLKIKNSELGLSEEQRAIVEARIAAGLPRDLKVINDKTKAIDEQAAANYRLDASLQKQKEDKGKAEGIESELKGASEDTSEYRAVQADADKSPLQRALNAIERIRAKRETLIRSLQIEAGLRDRLLAQNDAQAEGDKNTAVVDDQLAKVTELSDYMTSLWDNPREAMKAFFADLLKNLVMNIAKATILKSLMPGGGGGGGSIGSSIANSISGALGFGGGKAVGGGVSSSKFYLVGEKGPELFAPGKSGTIIPNHNIGGSGGGGSTSISLGNTNINIMGGANDNTVQQMDAQLVAHRRMTMKLVDERLRKKGR